MVDYKLLKENYVKLLTDNVLSDKENKKLSQIRSYLDTALKEALTKSFQNESEKTAYLTQVLFQTRDYLIAENIENSFKLSLLKAFDQIDNEFLKSVQAEEEILDEKKV